MSSEAPRWGQLRALRWAIVALYFARRLRQDPPPVIHAHFANAPATVALLLASWLGRPWGFSAHARDLYAERVDFPLKVSRANHVFACSENSSDDLRRRLPPELQHRVHALHHGVDLELWNQRAAPPNVEGIPLILAVGRFEPKKGFAYLVEACGILRDERVPFRCELIGDGLEEERLARQIEARGLDPYVRIIPWCSASALREHYARAWALAVPSVIAVDGDRDNIPNVVIEALASGVPVVASALPAIARALEPSGSGYLVPPGDARALARALRAVCNDANVSRTLEDNARRLAREHFDLRSNVRRLRDLLSRTSAEGSLRCAS